MKNTPIVVERLLDAPIERVWSAISSKEEMDKWYFMTSSFEPRPGHQFKFSGQGRKGEEYIHLCEVKEAVPMKKLSYSWRYEGMPGDSLVTFELFPEGDKTKIKLTHTSIESFATDSPDFAPSSFNEGWNAILGQMLPDYLVKSIQNS